MTGPGTPRVPWKRIAADLRAAIARGEYKPGARLPSILHLSGECGVSPGTARKALRALADEGLAMPAPGRGYFVAHVRPSPAHAGTTRVAQLFILREYLD